MSPSDSQLGLVTSALYSGPTLQVKIEVEILREYGLFQVIAGAFVRMELEPSGVDLKRHSDPVQTFQ